LERTCGQALSGIMSSGSISWNIGRKKGDRDFVRFYLTA